MRHARLLLSAFVWLAALTTLAQRTATVEGYAIMYPPDDMTPREARAKVVELARFNALEREFGSNVTRNNISFVRNDDQGSDVSFYALGESDLRGIWIRDIEKPRVKKREEDGRDIIEAWVKGEAQERVLAEVTFQWKLLRNGTEDQCEVAQDNVELWEEDEFWLKFRSPVKGYLLVFMADDKGSVYHLVPQAEDYCRVKRGEWYLFPEEEPFKATLPEGRLLEIDQLYFVFSPNELYPPVSEVPDNKAEIERYKKKVVPVKELSFADFQRYLNKALRDPRLQVEKAFVKIHIRK